MPTDFDTSFATNDVIEASHVLQYADPVNNLETGASYYAVDEASSDAYVVTLDPVPASYTAGMIVNFKANTANTGAATIDTNSLGAKAIKKRGTLDLESGDITADQVTCLIYDGTNFQLVSSGSAPTNLSDLSDVEIASPTDGQVLVYDGITNNRWENRDLAAAQVTFDDSGLSHITGSTVQAALASVDSQLGGGGGGGFTGSTAQKSSTQTLSSAGSYGLISWDSTALDDTGGYWDSGNYSMTAQADGVHFVSVSLAVAMASASAYFQLAIYKNGSIFGTYVFYWSPFSNSNAPIPFSHVLALNLEEGDYIQIYGMAQYSIVATLYYGHFSMIGPA